MTILGSRLYRRGKWRQEEDGHESVTDVYEVLSDTDSETITAVLAASGVPAKGASHPERSDAIVKTREADHDGEVLTVWYVSCNYDTKWETKEDDAPLAQNVKGGMKSAWVEEPAYFDAFGNALVNSAGDVYEGLTKRRRLREVNVTANVASLPTYIFDRAETVNAAAVTILGTSYPAGTCLLTEVEFPDEPQRGNEGTEFYPLSFKILIDPDGHHILLPNKGVHELVYQTRATAEAGYSDATYTEYVAHAADDGGGNALKRIIKRRIQTDEQQDIAADIWLDAYGQAQRVVTLQTSALGVGGMSSGGTTLTLTSGTFDYDAGTPLESLHLGAYVVVMGAGRFGRPLRSRITAVSSTTVATLADVSHALVSGKNVYVSGAIVNRFLLPEIADWSGIPLPNNEP